jgi:hypothetical protein
MQQRRQWRIHTLSPQSAKQCGVSQSFDIALGEVEAKVLVEASDRMILD